MMIHPDPKRKRWAVTNSLAYASGYDKPGVMAQLIEQTRDLESCPILFILSNHSSCK
jgi:hypothetical protein